MTPFQPAILDPDAFDAARLQAKFGLSADEAAHVVERFSAQQQWLNDTYQVAVMRVGCPFGAGLGDLVHLSIKRRDKAPIHDWRELQAIKNELVGPECEGMELYPAESRLVDTANQYHLRVFVDPATRFPLGFQERLVTGPETAAAIGARQRAFG
jgi:hypothetical protein